MSRSLQDDDSAAVKQPQKKNLAGSNQSDCTNTLITNLHKYFDQAAQILQYLLSILETSLRKKFKRNSTEINPGNLIFVTPHKTWTLQLRFKGGENLLKQCLKVLDVEKNDKYDI